MKSILMLSLVLLIVIFHHSNSFPSKHGNCPLASYVKRCTPKCYSDYECSGNKICCSNYCGWKSCTEPSNVPHDKDKETDTAVYCENVRCQPKQICKFDPKTKRSKCAYP